jgi:anti-sigma factor RsiW
MSCHRIDEYLDGELDEPDRSLFEQHLARCSSCAIAVDQQHQLSRLLKAATEQLDRPSPELMRKIDRRLRASRRKRYLAGVVVVATAAALAWIYLHMPARRNEPIPSERMPAVEIADARPARSQVRISFANQSKLLIVPVETGSPNVTFVWVYPNQRKAN